MHDKKPSIVGRRVSATPASARVGFSDLTPRQRAILSAVEGKALGTDELVARLGIDGATLGDIVRRLIKRGLLVRHRSKKDLRAYAIALTDRGRRAVKTLESRKEGRVEGRGELAHVSIASPPFRPKDVDVRAARRAAREFLRENPEALEND